MLNFRTFSFQELHSNDPVNEPLRPYRPRQDISMPDVITVRIDEGFYLSDRFDFLFFYR